MNLTTALPTFVITLREGFEATLVVGIVLACLHKAGQSYLNKWVYGGAIAGVFTSLLLGLILGLGMQQLGNLDGQIIPVIQEVLAGFFTLAAIILLSWMLFWMTKQAASLKSEVQTAVATALENPGTGRGVFTIAFLAVTREGFETVLFLLTQFGSGVASIIPILGAIAGLLLAILLGILLFQWGIKINIQKFFQIMGVFLLLIVAGLVVSSFHAFDEAAAILATINPDYQHLCFSTDSCILGKQIWDFSNSLPEKKLPGILLKSLFGYRDHIYFLQFFSYLIFLVSALTIYFSELNKPVPQKQTHAPDLS